MLDDIRIVDRPPSTLDGSECRGLKPGPRRYFRTRKHDSIFPSVDVTSRETLSSGSDPGGLRDWDDVSPRKIRGVRRRLPVRCVGEGPFSLPTRPVSSLGDDRDQSLAPPRPSGTPQSNVGLSRVGLLRSCHSRPYLHPPSRWNVSTLLRPKYVCPTYIYLCLIQSPGIVTGTFFPFVGGGVLYVQV